MNVLILGGSRNVGYYAAQRLLAKGATVTFLLRNKATFDNDESIKPYIASGKVRIVPGDALNEEDVRQAWKVAAEGVSGHVDTLLFTVGSRPKFSLTKGFTLDPPILCTRGMLNVLSTMPLTDPQPKVILVSSAGMGKRSHAALPLLLKPLFGYLLAVPHEDKLGMERVVAHAAGWMWTHEEPKQTILPEGWQKQLPEPGFLKDVLVLQPTLFIGEKCVGDEGKKNGKAPYRAADHDLPGAYTISRKDVAHFIVEGGMEHWDEWKGKSVRLAY